MRQKTQSDDAAEKQNPSDVDIPRQETDLEPDELVRNYADYIEVDTDAKEQYRVD